jgi:hypothetical protein
MNNRVNKNIFQLDLYISNQFLSYERDMSLKMSDKSILKILSRVSLIKTRVWISESIYWFFTSRNNN